MIRVWRNWIRFEGSFFFLHGFGMETSDISNSFCRNEERAKPIRMGLDLDEVVFDWC